MTPLFPLSPDSLSPDSMRNDAVSIKHHAFQFVASLAWIFSPYWGVFGRIRTKRCRMYLSPCTFSVTSRLEDFSLMPLTDIQKEFLKKYLNLAYSDASVTVSKDKLLDIWRAAKEQTDAGVSDLQKALKRHKSAELDRIAEAGLNGITEGNSVAMMGALMEYDAAGGPEKSAAGSKLLKQVEAYRNFLDHSPLVALAEDNPFGVAVVVKAPLHAALNGIAAAIPR